MFFVQYTPTRSRVALGLLGKDWQQNVITQLHTALNEWTDSLPSHRAL
jgi:hypothetical protein